MQNTGDVFLVFLGAQLYAESEPQTGDQDANLDFKRSFNNTIFAVDMWPQKFL